jgi:hypothetical protein
MPPLPFAARRTAAAFASAFLSPRCFASLFRRYASFQVDTLI